MWGYVHIYTVYICTYNSFEATTNVCKYSGCVLYNNYIRIYECTYIHIFPMFYIADPVVTLTPAVDPQEGNATDNVTLTCSWNSTVFYLVWFKDGTSLYSRDFVSGVTEDSTGASVAVEVGGLNSTLTFSRVSDSGNYTCAVTCRAKDRAEEDIPVQFKATKEVLIYGGLE